MKRQIICFIIILIAVFGMLASIMTMEYIDICNWQHMTAAICCGVVAFIATLIGAIDTDDR